MLYYLLITLDIMKRITRLKQVSENVMSHESNELNVVAPLQAQWELTFGLRITSCKITPNITHEWLSIFSELKDLHALM